MGAEPGGGPAPEEWLLASPTPATKGLDFVLHGVTFCIVSRRLIRLTITQRAARASAPVRGLEFGFRFELVLKTKGELGSFRNLVWVRRWAP